MEAVLDSCIFSNTSMCGKAFEIYDKDNIKPRYLYSFTVLVLFVSAFPIACTYSRISFTGHIDSVIINPEKISLNNLEYKEIFLTIKKEVDNSMITLRVLVNASDKSVESLKIDDESILQWDFCKGNYCKISADKINGYWTQIINSAEDHIVIKWSENVGKDF